MERRSMWVRGFSHDSLQDTLDQAGREGGAIVRLEAGRYLIERPLLIDSDTTIAGLGRSRTTLVLASGVGTHMMENRSPGAERIAVRSLTLDGDAEGQAHPEDHAHLLWACGACFRQTTWIRILDVDAVRIRQTALHFGECTDVVIENLVAEDLGWSGVSSAGTDEIVLRSVVVRRAGLDITHSGIHLDGGARAYVDAVVEDTTGNGIMIDSTYRAMTDVVVRGTVRRSHRGLSLSGSHAHPLRNVLITGTYTDNTSAGVQVSNAEQVFVVDTTVARNGEYGILLQGRAGARRCTIADCTFEDNPVAVGQLHASTGNFFPAASVDGTTPSPPSMIARCSVALRAHTPSSVKRLARTLVGALRTSRPRARGEAHAETGAPRP